jgi:hypothetical protein
LIYFYETEAEPSGVSLCTIFGAASENQNICLLLKSTIEIVTVECKNLIDVPVLNFFHNVKKGYF